MASTLKTELILNDSNFQAKLSSACNKAKASLQQVSQSTKGLSGMLGNLSGQIGGLTGQLGNFLNSAKMLANPWVAAGAAITGAGVAFFNYNKNLEQTLNRTQQFTGLSGNELNSLRNGIAATAQTFGKDFNEVLSGVDGLMSQFGISGETALNIIKDGFVAGADDSKNFLENLGKYSGAFNDIGVGADELSALLAQTRSGIFSEEGMDAIQMAGKNIRTMSNSAKQSLAAIGISGDDMIQKLSSGQMTTMQAIRQISGALKKLPPQSQEVGNVLQDVFGKKGSAAGYELITALEGVSTNLEEVKKQTGEDGKVLDELADTTRDFENACQSLFGVTDSGFSHLTDQLKIHVLQALTKVINKFIDLYNKSYLVRGGIALIARAFEAMWNSVKAILKHLADTLMGTLEVLEGLVTLDFGRAGKGFERVLKGVNFVALAGEIGNNIGDAMGKAFEDTMTGHIDKVERALDPVKDKFIFDDIRKKGKNSVFWTENRGKQVEEFDAKEKERKEKEAARNYSGTSSGKSGKSGKTGKVGKSNTDKKDNKVEPVAGSLGDLEKQLKDLQDKYKNGLIKITPEDYNKQVKELEDKIQKKKIELKLTYDENSLQGLEEQLKKLQDNQKAVNTELHLDTKEYNKQVADLTKKIQAKKLDLALELDENSLSVLEQKLKNLEENQVSENVYLHIDGEEYKKQHKELEQQIESEKINLGISLSLDDANKQFTDLMNDYKKKSSFEMAVGQEKINKRDYDGQLQNIQQQMDENDQLLEQLKELQKAYKDLGEAGSTGYSQISSQIANVEAEQTKLGQSATKTNELSKSQKKLSKNLNDAGDAVGNLGSAFSSLSQVNDDPVLNIAGTVAQGIASIIQGAGSALAEAGSLGPIGWVSVGAMIMAQLASMIAQIHSLSGYSQGGWIGGGKSVGDKQLIKVNSGEFVMNTGQQARLWRILNGESSMQMQPALAGGQVQFKISGSNLVGVLDNYSRKHSKI